MHGAVQSPIVAPPVEIVSDLQYILYEAPLVGSLGAVKLLLSKLYTACFDDNVRLR